MTTTHSFLIVILCLLLLTTELLANENAGDRPNRYTLKEVHVHTLEQNLAKSKDNMEAIRLLGQIAAYYVDRQGDYTHADSLLNEGIERARLSYANDQLNEAYANYLIIMDDYHYSDRVTEVINAMTALLAQVKDPEAIWKSKYALAKGYQMIFKLDEARDQAYQALTKAIQIKDDEKTVQSQLLIGNILHAMNNNVEAIRNFLDALTIAEKAQDVDLRMLCFSELSKFYNLIKAYDKSIQYKLKELDLAEHASNADSVRIMTLKFDLEVVSFNNRTLNEKQLYNILEFADRHEETKLKKICLIAFRNHLIKQNDFAELYHLFHDEFPEELADIQQTDTTTYYRLEALFEEHLGNMDSAQYYFILAEARIMQASDILRQSSFYLRYGDFLCRRDRSDEALAKYLKAFTLAAEVPYYTFMIEATEHLNDLYYASGDFQNAYKYVRINKEITDSLRNFEEKEQFQLIELENEETLREQRVEQEREATRHRNNVQYYAIIVLITSAFILLTVLSGYKVSPTFIRMMGFLTFIFFFEFIILLFDTWIHHVTHGEPWKVLGIKILLMSGLLPLHHLIEKRVTHYLIHHNPKMFLRRKVNLENTDIP